MKILQINTSVNTGSTGRIAENIGKALLANADRSNIAYGRTNNGSQSETYRIGSDWGYLTNVLCARLFDNYGFSSRTSTKRFVKYIADIKPDIIHFHNLHGYYIDIKTLFAFLSTQVVPIIWTLHDCWPLTGHCAHFEYVNCNRWETVCYNCPNSHRYPASWFVDSSKSNHLQKKQLFTAQENITIVTPSKWLADIVHRSFLNKYPVKVIPNGIDLNLYKPYADSATIRKKHGINNSAFILGVANKWDRIKGMNDFIRLSSLLKNGEVIVLVGVSKEQQKQLPANIIGLNRTENAMELASLYTEANAFVNPTWVDNFPTTNLEALACGTPVITYNSGGSPEAIDEETGYVISKGNIQGLYNAVQEVIRQGKDKYRQKCRKRAEDLYNVNDRTNDYTELYQKTLNKS